MTKDRKGKARIYAVLYSKVVEVLASPTSSRVARLAEQLVYELS
jgi:hypothetical protein